MGSITFYQVVSDIGVNRGCVVENAYPSLSKTLAANALTIDSNCDSLFGSITKAFASVSWKVILGSELRRVSGLTTARYLLTWLLLGVRYFGTPGLIYEVWAQ